MKKKILIVFLVLFQLGVAWSQTVVKGIVREKDGTPLVGASIFVEGTFNGTSATTDGKYSLKCSANHSVTLVCSFVGFEEKRQLVDIHADTVIVDFVLKEKVNEMKAVVLTAGSFGAAESKKAVILSPYDILTTPTAVGDVYGALQSLPGNSVVGEDGGIFVRGGEAEETKTFIDGLLVQRPMNSRQPDLPARGRFSPNLFTGTVFSTGGYSAEYGQALSSALLLNTDGVAQKSLTGISVLPFGGGLSQTLAADNQSLSVSADYYNMTPMYKVVPQNVTWIDVPQNLSSNIIYRRNTKQNGLLKVFVNYDIGNSAVMLDNTDYPGKMNKVKLDNSNLYTSVSYNSDIEKLWQVKTGVSFTRDKELIVFNGADVNTYRNGLQARVSFLRKIGDLTRVKFGAEQVVDQYEFKYYEPTSSVRFNPDFVHHLSSCFAETDYRIGNNIALRAGLRYEYSALLKKGAISPRYSVAIKTSSNTQLSYAGGLFVQSPTDEALRVNDALALEKAFHHILNYQYVENGKTFRVEFYHKQYRDLIRYDSLNSPVANSFHSDGYGFARGIDLFWRDKHSFKNIDYWFSYSLLDTKRLYRDFPESATPRYFPKHTFSTVYKQYIKAIGSQVALSYNVASGRNYHNANLQGFMNDKTPLYQDLCMSISYVLQRNKVLTIVHASVSNVLGNNNIYGYHFSKMPVDSEYVASAIRPASKRFYLIGVFVSIEN